MIKRKAFTLIELLIVIGVIGVLAAVVLVSLSLAREKAYFSAMRKVGANLLLAISECEGRGGTVRAPNHATAPTNNFCTIDTGVRWPSPPKGWQWNTVSLEYLAQAFLLAAGQEGNIWLKANSVFSDRYTFVCGRQEFLWSSTCSSDPDEAYCRTANDRLGCYYHDEDTGYHP